MDARSRAPSSWLSSARERHALCVCASAIHGEGDECVKGKWRKMVAEGEMKVQTSLLMFRRRGTETVRLIRLLMGGLRADFQMQKMGKSKKGSNEKGEEAFAWPALDKTDYRQPFRSLETARELFLEKPPLTDPKARPTALDYSSSACAARCSLPSQGRSNAVPFGRRCRIGCSCCCQALGIEGRNRFR